MADPKLKLGNDIWATKQKSLLAYNDEGGNFKSLPFQVDRISGGSYVGRNGLIQTAASNEPRIDFLNNTKGHLLLEPSRRNDFTYSEDFSQGIWFKLNSTVTQSASTSPDGSQNAYNLHFNGTVNASLRHSITTTNTKIYTFSIWIKKISANYTNNNKARIEGFGSGAVGFLLLGDALNSAAVGEFVRYSVTTTASTGGTSYFQFRSDEEATFEVWGAQVEQGSYATSYIPTSGQSGGVTRSAETANNAGNSTVFNDSEGVLYAEIAALTDVDGDASLRFISLSNGTSSKRITIYYFSSETFGVQLKNDGYEVTDLYIGGSVDRTQFNKIALYYSGSNVKAYLNGIEVFTNSSWIPFPNNTINTLNFTDGSLSNSPFYGKVKDVRYYNTALSDSELQALTTI